jgi:hypothetical protein
MSGEASELSERKWHEENLQAIYDVLLQRPNVPDEPGPRAGQAPAYRYPIE